MRKASTLAVVIGVAACSPILGAGLSDRFFARGILAAGLDDPQPTPTFQELLQKGIEAYRWNNYEDAKRAFDQADKLSGLDDRQQQILSEYRLRMVKWGKGRREAEDALDAARKAYEQGDAQRANELASAAATNGHAADEVREEAKALIAKTKGGTHVNASTIAKQDVESSRRRQAQQLIATARRQLHEGEHRRGRGQRPRGGGAETQLSTLR